MILLHHDGDLQDARDLLRNLAVDFVERKGELQDEDRSGNWDLIIAPQRRVAAYPTMHDGERRQPVRVAIVDSNSRTLRTMLRRQGADYIIARPVHSLAFRLLLLHILYRGPERRALARVSVGAPIRIKIGVLPKRKALLAELSLRGARVTTAAKPREGKKIQLMIPAELGTSKSYKLQGRIVRASEDPEAEGQRVLAIEFSRVTPAQGQKLRKTFENHQCGPARISRSVPGVSEYEVVKPRIRGIADSTEAQTSIAEAERRGTKRHEYEARVIALDNDQTRVLICRDLSLGGMRVEPNPAIVPGDNFRIALHVESRMEPLVVQARVTRDDGEEGMVLTFHDLPSAAEIYLGKLVHSLPDLPGNDDREGLCPEFIISEILEDPED